MSAPFPRWSNTATRLGLVACAGMLFGVPAGLMAWMRSPLHTHEDLSVEQPVAFDHRHHVGDDGIGCRYCHFDAERSPNAGVPATEICMNCHSQIWTDSPLLAPVRESYFDHRPIRWRRVNELPDFVFFNHAIHVHVGVGCETCHGRVDRMPVVHAARSLQMEWCLNCHRKPWLYLRPPDKVTVMGYRPAESQETLGRRLARRLPAQPPTYCTGCHR